jgi:hypothetical protein
MKTLLLLMLFPMLVLGQEIPIKNKVILNYATTNYGKKVGTGLCDDLVSEAADLAGVKLRVNKRGYRAYGKQISPKRILPGIL